MSQSPSRSSTPTSASSEAASTPSVPVHSASAAVAVASAPPTAETLQHAPSVPPGWVVMTAEELRRLLKMTASQAIEAGAVAAELASSKTYPEDFGPHAPPQSLLVAALKNFAALNQEAPQAKDWSLFVRDMRAIEGDTALTLMDKLELVFKPAAANNPTIPQKYPMTEAFMQARSSAAHKAVQTKRDHQKAEAQKAQTTTGETPAAHPAGK